MINSQINILAQAKSYLHSVTSTQYRAVISPLFISSAGQHIRHILDHYIAIKEAIHSGTINYDKRSRGGTIETDIDAAMAQLDEIEEFLLSLSKIQLQQTIQLSTEVSVEKKQVEVVDTTLARELIFVGSHAIHHFAMIGQISKAQKLTIPEQFGIAPATATFMRDEQCAP
ncbi:hypothetical protein GCM10007916_20080 [Psychromonas marina]|uniref:DinB family protein n=1 Tax=Psychromonas marina TaxID=88364 RepID=A0ABQ6E0G5_9GAMM|nr:hypothetical protein [Psychromonas marina]GLS90941.1 hypothetical protein GCM10007916_20080 [Psychromonas marina]